MDKRNPLKIKVRAYRRGSGKSLYLSRIIMSAPGGSNVDHINGDTLDNRRSNLRVCSAAENQQNSGKYNNNKSGFKGVYWISRDKKWGASISKNGKRHYLGYFPDKKSAAIAYNNAAVEYHGSFAKLNTI